jgi:hypothetical protein
VTLRLSPKGLNEFFHPPPRWARRSAEDRCFRKAEVGGSNPPVSTPLSLRGPCKGAGLPGGVRAQPLPRGFLRPYGVQGFEKVPQMPVAKEVGLTFGGYGERALLRPRFGTRTDRSASSPRPRLYEFRVRPLELARTDRTPPLRHSVVHDRSVDGVGHLRRPPSVAPCGRAIGNGGKHRPTLADRDLVVWKPRAVVDSVAHAHLPHDPSGSRYHLSLR